MELKDIKRNITPSPRNKLITTILAVVIIAVISETTHYLKIPELSLTELKLNIIQLLPINLPTLIEKYLFLNLFLIILIIMIVIFLIKKMHKSFSKKQKQVSINITEENNGKGELEKQNILLREIENQRNPVIKILKQTRDTRKLKKKSEWIKTGISGFDELFTKGIPRGTATLLAGGPGSGKTIFCLQTLNNAALKGEKVLYISLEESEERLKKHMMDFNLNPDKLEKQGLLRITRVDPFNISRSVEALLAQAKGELRIDISETVNLLPENFSPDWVVVDSLTALEAAFQGGDDNYRIYMEQLFGYFEKLGITSFLITETEQIPTKFSKSGVEEFLADCVIILYYIKRGNIRERAIEVLKLRGGKHEEKIVAMKIESSKGIIVYPEQELIGEI